MSEETKTNEPVKQEGDFKIKSKKPKQLGNKEQEIKKVNLKEPLVQLPPEVTKADSNTHLTLPTSDLV